MAWTVGIGPMAADPPTGAGSFTHGDQITSNNVGLAPFSPTLITHNGDYAANIGGAVIENMNITGIVTVNAPNVTFRYCRLQQGINNAWTAANNFTCEDCDIGPLDFEDSVDVFVGFYVGMSNFTLRRCKMQYLSEHIRAQGDVLVEDCWAGDMTQVATDIQDPHYDVLQCVGSGQVGAITLRRVNFSADITHHKSGGGRTFTDGNACVMIGDTPSNGVVTLEDSLFSGGAYSITLADGTLAAGLSYVVTGNKFKYATYIYGPSATDQTEPGQLTASNNTWYDGPSAGQPVSI